MKKIMVPAENNPPSVLSAFILADYLASYSCHQHFLPLHPTDWPFHRSF